MSMATRSTRKAVLLVSPNIMPSEDAEFNAEVMRNIFKTYTQLKRLENKGFNTSETSVLSFEIPEYFYTFIKNRYTLEHGAITLATHSFYDPDLDTDYICLSSAQFKAYLAAYKSALEDARTAQVEYLNTLTEELNTLRPFLSLLEET